MADFEDANSPTWHNMVDGQANLVDAIDRTIEFESPDGKSYRLNEEVATLLVRPRGWHLVERHFQVDGQADLGEPVRLRPLSLPQREAAPRARDRPVPLPAEAREPPRGAALERRLHAHGGGARPPARVDQGDRADRDRPRRVRDGRDPLGAARARGRPQRGALGLHVQRHQEVPRAARVRPARPEQRDDDRAVHARVHGAARQDLSPPRSARDGRDGRVHPEPEGPGAERARAREGARGQAARGGRRLRRHLGRAPRPRPGGARGVRRRARRPAEPARAAARRRRHLGRRPPERRGDGGRGHRGGPPQRRERRDPVPVVVAAAVPAPRRSTT